MLTYDKHTHTYVEINAYEMGMWLEKTEIHFKYAKAI